MGAVQGPAAARTIRLLEYDPELGETLRPERRVEAERTARATLIELPRGSRGGETLVGGREAAYGVLLLGGLANRTVVLGESVSAQLLGRGDLVRIGAGDLREALVETDVRWTVIEPLAAALLDEQFLMTVRRWPELVAALFGRLAAQEERRDVHRALSQLPRVEDRVHALMWLLAERWGHVTTQGVTLRLRLTHELIGQLVGAKRPTVSLALKQLEARGSVHRRADGSWLLEQAWIVSPHGDPGAGSEGAGILPGPEPLAAGPQAMGPQAMGPQAMGSYTSSAAEVRARVERMRRLHARVRDEVAETLALSTMARERSGSLRRP